jgi:ParB family chromosome partitioning protein
MKDVRGGLGRGLEALIPRGTGGLQEIDVERIEPSSLQPRQQIDTAALEELASSIQQHGLLEPLLVARAETGYRLIAGERRWRAAKMAGLTSVPALVKDVSPQETLELALVENLQRADLTALEEAGAYRLLIDEFGMTQERVAARVGRSRVAVTNRLRLLGLPADTKALLADGRISEGHARALLGCADASMIDGLAARVVDRELSVRDTEELVRRLSGGPDPGVLGPKSQTEPAVTEAESGTTQLEEELGRALGTRVQIQRSRRGGRVVLHYFNEDQLAGLIEALLARQGG